LTADVSLLGPRKMFREAISHEEIASRRDRAVWLRNLHARDH
jgi:hypothetical protein